MFIECSGLLEKGKETQDETKTCDVDIETGIESRHGTWVGLFSCLQHVAQHVATVQSLHCRYTMRECEMVRLIRPSLYKAFKAWRIVCLR